VFTANTPRSILGDGNVASIPFKNLKRVGRRLADSMKSPSTYHGGWLGLLGSVIAGGQTGYYTLPKKDREAWDQYNEYKTNKKPSRKVRSHMRKYTFAGAIPGILLGGAIGAKIGLLNKLRMTQRVRFFKRNASWGRTRGGAWGGTWGGPIRPSGININQAKTNLGIGNLKTKADVIKRHRTLVKEFHPDVAKDKVTAGKKIVEINKSWETVKNSDWFKKLAHVSLRDYARIVVS